MHLYRSPKVGALINRTGLWGFLIIFIVQDTPNPILIIKTPTLHCMFWVFRLFAVAIMYTQGVLEHGKFCYMYCGSIGRIASGI